MFTSIQLKLAGLAIVLFIISLFFLNVEHKNTKIEKLSNANVIAELRLDTAVSTIEETKKEENQTKFQIEQICITNDNSKIINNNEK